MPPTTPPRTPTLDHPSLPHVRRAFPDAALKASEFRGMTTIICPREQGHRILRFLRDDPNCAYDFLCDVVGVDYLDYPAKTQARFAVVYVLASTVNGLRLAVKIFIDAERDTSGIEEDPGLVIDSAVDIWPGAEWPEREVFDMFGIRFRNHPDLRRILMWKEFPAHPLRKDYPLRGRGERETYRVIGREEA